MNIQEIREDGIEKLTAFYDSEGQWQEDFVDNDDFLEPYYYILNEKYKFFYEEIDEDIRGLVKKEVDNIDDFDSWLDKYTTLELTHGIQREANEINSVNIGELELQVCEEKENKIIKEYNLTDEDIKEAQENIDYYYNDGYIYINMGYSRVSLTFNEDSWREDNNK